MFAWMGNFGYLFGYLSNDDQLKGNDIGPVLSSLINSKEHCGREAWWHIGK